MSVLVPGMEGQWEVDSKPAMVGLRAENTVSREHVPLTVQLGRLAGPQYRVPGDTLVMGKQHLNL